VLEVAELAEGLEVAEVIELGEVPASVGFAEALLHAAVSKATPAALTSKPTRGENIRRRPPA
jgi:hypothetical protein